MEVLILNTFSLCSNAMRNSDATAILAQAVAQATGTEADVDGAAVAAYSARGRGARGGRGNRGGRGTRGTRDATRIARNAFPLFIPSRCDDGNCCCVVVF